jgi:hypothetical protein
MLYYISCVASLRLHPFSAHTLCRVAPLHKGDRHGQHQKTTQQHQDRNKGVHSTGKELQLV